MNALTAAQVGIRSALRGIVTIAAAIVALDQAGLLDPAKLVTVKGLLALAVAIIVKGASSAATAKTVEVKG